MLRNTLLQAAQKGGEVLQHYYQKQFEISSKTSLNNLVTEADKKSEEVIINCIKEQFPEHYIFTEEAGEMPSNSEYKWIIDPLDGTVNFAHGLPLCAVSIGLEKNGEIIMGVVYAPFLNELYIAEKGKGATCNGNKIQVSKQDNFEKSFLVTGFSYEWEIGDYNPLQAFENAVKNNIPVRRIGTAAVCLAWVAAGRFDGYWEHNLHAYDTAAGFLLVTEAGGTVTNFKKETYTPYDNSLLASNGLLHNNIHQLINK
jgi:myo-inositol-1(or 4)-monophosphatase